MAAEAFFRQWERAFATLGMFEGLNERRRRGMRLALDWRDSFRVYLLVPIGLVGSFSGGVELLVKPGVWPRLVGALLLVATVGAVARLLRWLLLPPDPESVQRLRARREEQRLEWPSRRQRRQRRTDE